MGFDLGWFTEEVGTHDAEELRDARAAVLHERVTAPGAHGHAGAEQIYEQAEAIAFMAAQFFRAAAEEEVAAEELGGHKGYGLGLFVDLLCAGMSIGTWSRDTFVKNGGARVAQFFGRIMRTDLFGKI